MKNLGTGAGPNDLITPKSSTTEIPTTTTSTESPPPTIIPTTIESGPEGTTNKVLLSGADIVQGPGRSEFLLSMDTRACHGLLL